MKLRSMLAGDLDIATVTFGTLALWAAFFALIRIKL